MRLRELRKTLKLTQEEFGKRLGVTKTAISRLESEDRNLTEQMVLSICREFNVNEDWLRTGEGEMFMLIPEDDEIASLVYDLLDPKGNDFYTIVLATIQAFDQLSPNSQKVVQELCGNIIENLKKKKGD